MSVRSFGWLALLPLVCAFKDTAPIVVWSSHRSGQLDSLAARLAPFAQPSNVFDALLKETDLCQYQAVVIAEQPGLHASDLRTLSKSYLSARLNSAASSLQIPYLPHTDNHAFDEFKRLLTQRCGSRRVELNLGQGGVNFHQGDKHVICVSMPHLEGESTERKDAIRSHDAQLANELSGVTSVFPSHLVIYTGSPPLAKRQDSSEDDSTPFRPVLESSSAFAPVNTTLVQGSLLQRYRFFTPGLITALLIVFGLLIPVLMVGIYALASIQSPLRMDAPKGPSMEKKNQ
ncbi:hypothetical protein K439DRAFT_1627961 [Ramaria rubella]|nr:hypothetical protein K439DRAFT_1627961 [Ramaria rubella]